MIAAIVSFTSNIDITPAIQGTALKDAVWEHTWGSLSVDIKRPHFDNDRDQNSLLRKRSPDVRFSDTGARVKVMRHVALFPGWRFEHASYGGKWVERPMLDLGAGVSFEVDTASIQPKARLKLGNIVSLRVLPDLGVNLKFSRPIGTTGYAVTMKYFCPMDELANFYQPPAKLLVVLDNSQDYGVKLHQGGIELNGNTWIWGDRAHVRASALVHLPSSIPLRDDEDLIKIEPRRCGLKMKW